MSPWIPKAVLTAEDGDFFFHNGINWFTFKNAVERNFSAGEVELGASTLTMQLIKNLFLSPDRALMRKIHEAVLVYLTEEAVPVSKDRLLELYLNLVEFGPGLLWCGTGLSTLFWKKRRRHRSSGGSLAGKCASFSPAVLPVF